MTFGLAKQFEDDMRPYRSKSPRCVFILFLFYGYFSSLTRREGEEACGHNRGSRSPPRQEMKDGRE